MSANQIQFDWSSMIYDVFNKEKQQPQQQQQAQQQAALKKLAMSPLNTNNEEEVWLDDLLSDDMSNSLFSKHDVEEKFLESATTSFENTPLIKAENDLEDIPSFINLNAVKEEDEEADEQQQQQHISRNSSIDSMFRDIFSDMEGEDENSNSATPVASNSENSSASNSTTNMALDQSKSAPKPKKKRAPRKRLTDHQKLAHNKIEKRYRININAKIAGLQKIIPWVSGEKTAFEIGDENNDNDDEQAQAALPRMNKSMILDKATLYILHLQENERSLKMENEELKKKLQLQ